MISSSLIIGGGLSGLSLGLRLSRRGDRVLILESESNLGGLARSYPVEGVVFDFGPHVFRSRDDSLIDWVSSLTKMNEYQSKPGTYKYGQIFDHIIPVITWENIGKLPKNVQERAITEIRGLRRDRDFDNNFEDVVESQVGETLCREFFSEYSKKWWGIEPKLLSAELAPSNLRIGDDSSYSHITTAFMEPKREFYPAGGGYGSIPNALINKLSTLHNATVRTDSRVTDLVCEGGRISGVVINGEEELPVKGEVFSTAPLTDIAAMLGEQINLNYRADICVFVVLEGKNFRKFEKSWLYFPEKNIVFSRLCRAGHFSVNNEKKGLIGITAEITCFKDDGIWRMENDELVSKVLDSLEGIGFINERKVVAARVIREGSAYPLLTVGYNNVRKEFINNIREIASNLILIGRTGSFQYQNSDAALSLYG